MGYPADGFPKELGKKILKDKLAIDGRAGAHLQPVDLVASTCGFGTTQGLRESVKEYLGLVPSELRTIPESLIDMD